MECRTLDLTLISAKDLKDISLFAFGKMDVYAVVSISGTVRKLRTPLNKCGGPNPTWNSPMRFMVYVGGAMDKCLVIKIKAIGMFTNWKLGQVKVPIKELMESVKSDDGSPMHVVSYRLRRPSGKTTKGEVCCSYKFGEKFMFNGLNHPPPYVGYPPQQHPTDSESDSYMQGRT
ncbi:hypothetical protein OSB04_009303 [Centaurea solstitialis]|uniref:C2 domain-containing protein n=1 Tax=Centaurea solstitialis TaxID=347529 RepID=A0AA38WM09_9ASTR|nr:hypothetical protein OSB04_009303 [Centaurea solstitialis]